MKALAYAVSLAVLVPSLAWAHGGGVDAYGCHHDKKAGDYHCHQGKLKGRSFKSQDTMLAAHPEMRSEEGKKSAGERAKKEKAEDKLKDGDKTTTTEYAKDAKKKSPEKSR
jgi:hypothetical protein